VPSKISRVDLVLEDLPYKIQKTNLKTTMKIIKMQGYHFVNFRIYTLNASALRAYFNNPTA
jgi:hypothetical protein